MTPIEWRDHLALGVPELDEQHRQLAVLINRIAEASGVADAGPEAAADPAVAALLEKLYRETRRHFEQEEALMAAVDYPGAAEHRREHVMLLGELKSWSLQVRRRNTPVRERDLAELRDWLVGHVVGPDREFARAYLAWRWPYEQQDRAYAGR